MPYYSYRAILAANLKKDLIMTGCLSLLNRYKSQVAELTDCNDHNGAIRKIAEYAIKKNANQIPDNFTLKAIDALITLHKRYNCMTPALYTIRADLQAQVFGMLTYNEELYFKSAL